MNDKKKKRIRIIAISLVTATIGFLSGAGNNLELTFSKLFTIAAFVVPIVLVMLFSKRREEDTLELRQEVDYYDEDEVLELEDDNRNYKQSDLV